MIARAAEYANGRTQFGQPIANYGLIQVRWWWVVGSTQAPPRALLGACAYITLPPLQAPLSSLLPDPAPQEKFARMALDAYAVEAMSYMTTGLIDGARGPGGGPMDASIEAAICKVYGSEAMMSAANDCIQVRSARRGEGVTAAAQ
jgi:alkylation response protein AidB-like acyl-CoA dehydrogenase